LKTILITGATSGIGQACAEIFAARHYRLIITGRRKERLDLLSQKLQSEYQCEVLPICFDVRDYGQTEAALSALPEPFANIDVLINNAGLASGFGSIQSGQIADWEKMIDTNIKGLLYVTKVVCQNMIRRKSGHIINIASIAGKEVYANGNVYCATKHAVDALSRSMRIDMLPAGIKVTNVAPGMVETEFSLVRFGGDAERAKNVYQGLQPLTAHDIATVIDMVVQLPPNLVVNDITLTPLAQASANHAIRS
jgi:3-hydroxy acid dehydrogenase/malonic semialdehyde reductase